MKLNIILVLTILNSMIICYLLLNQSDSTTNHLKHESKHKINRSEDQVPIALGTNKKASDIPKKEKTSILVNKKIINKEENKEEDKEVITGHDFETSPEYTEEALFPENDEDEAKNQMMQEKKKKFYEKKTKIELIHIKRNISGLKEILAAEGDSLPAAEKQRYLDEIEEYEREYDQIERDGVPRLRRSSDSPQEQN